MLLLQLWSFLVWGSIANAALQVEITPSSDVTAMKRKQVYLRCKVSGYTGTPPRIDFAKDGKIFTRPPPFPLNWEFGKILLIRPLFVGKSDGYYECIVRKGNEVIRKGIRVTVKDSKSLPAGFPRVRDTLKAIYPYYGDNFTLPCDHTGNPRPVITWFHSRKPLNMSDPRRKLLPNGSLLIVKTTEADRGYYECELRNMFGILYSEHDVVYPRPTPPIRIAPKFSKVLKDITLDSEESIWLSCAATGVPTPVFSWLKDGEYVFGGIDGHLFVEKIIQSANYSCQARNVVGNRLSTARINVRPKPLSPTTPEFVSNSPSTITISWKKSRREIYPITYFVIQHKLFGAANWQEDVVQSSQMQFTLKGLKPYTFATFRILAANSAGRSKPSEPYDFHSGETVPTSPAYNLHGKGLSDTSIFAEWMPPRIPNGRIEGYRVYYTTDPSYVLSDWVMKHAGFNYTTITQLEKNAVFYFKVQVYGVKGDGPMSNETAVVRALKGAPGLPLALSGRALNSRSVRLSWIPPRYHGNGLDGYEIRYKAPGVKSKETLVDYGVQTTIVQGLKPYSNYSFEIAAKSYAGAGPFSKPVIIQTHEDKPTAAPMNVRALPRSSTSIEVFWRPPPQKDQNGIITGYKIMYTPVRRATPKILSAPADSKSALLMGLRKFTRYTIWMLAINKAGEGPATHKFELFTEEDVPDTAPTDIRAQALNSSAISVTWGPPAERSGRIQGYIIYCMPVQESKELIPGVTMPFRKMSRGSINRQVILTDNIKPLQWYRIDVAAYNVKGDGIRSNKVYVKTPRKLPPSPRVTMLQNQVTPEVTLTWRPRIAGVIGYKIVFGKSLEQYGNVVNQRTKTFPASVRRHRFRKLSRGVWYSFRVSADIKDKGWSSENIKWILTPEGRPSGAPANVKATTESSSSILLSWEKPEPWKINGKILKYMIRYRKVGMDAQWNWKAYTLSKDEGSMSQIINGLESNSEYSFQIQAATRVGSGPLSVSVSAKTNTEVLPVVKRLEISKATTNSALITWKQPAQSSRFSIEGYRIECIGSKMYTDDKGNRRHKNSTFLKQVIGASFIIKGLVPDMQYRVQVSVVTTAGIGQTEMKLFVTKRAAPDNLKPPHILKEKITSDCIPVKLYQASQINGPVEFYSLFVVDLGKTPSEKSKSMAPEDFINARRAKRNINSTTKPYYVAAHFQSSELPTVFDVGSGSTKDNVINRRLKKGSTYNFFLRCFVRKEAEGGYLHTSSPFSGAVKFDGFVNSVDGRRVGSGESNGSSGGSLSWIAAIVVGLVLLIVVVLLVIVIKKRRGRKRHRDTDEDVKKPLRSKGVPSKGKPMDPVELHRMTYQTPGMMSHPPISVEAFESHVELHKKNENIMFLKEFMSIDPGQTFTSESSMQLCNRAKNRYACISAYDHTRTKLEFQGDLGSDYINANFIDGYCKEKAYIATQGPMRNTINDFWRMCWEQNTTTIVMMTQLEERGRPKCEQYWPSNGLATYGNIRVGMRDQLELANYTRRTFEVAMVDGHETRVIKQFQFTSWPDPGAPQNPAPLLQFVRRVKTSVVANTGPIIVHCSAGVGRTACYIVIDAMLDKIKNEKKVDIYGYVTMLRSQRKFMLQTDEQYIFVHDVILEAIQTGTTEVAATQLLQHFKKLNDYYSKTNGDTLLEEEFKNIVNATVPYSLGSTTAQAPINKQKNRCQSIIPYESNRVSLQTLRGHDGSDYINASLVDGYRERKAFIACQGPIEETVDDFWRMVMEQSCSIVVMLTNLDEKGKEQCWRYWPKEKSLRYHYYVVDPVSETRMPFYVVREFKVTDARDGEARSIRQFQYLNWLHGGVPASTEGLVELIGQVQRAYNQLNGGGPIVVHSSAGAGRTGVYIACSIILERLRVENVLDLYQTVKTLRLERPYMVQTVEQYQFCYQVAVDFLKNFDFVV